MISSALILYKEVIKKGGKMYHYNDYTYRVVWSEDRQEFIGRCIEFPELFSSGSNANETTNKIQELVEIRLLELSSRIDKIPVPYDKREYSGEIQLNIPSKLHKRLVMEAAKSGINISSLIETKLSY